jgi:uncharacterized membrane protein
VGNALPRDVNAAGVMVGRVDALDDAGNASAGTRAVYWDEGGNVHELPRVQDTTEADAFAINDRGVIVGHELTPEPVTTEARLWLDGEVHELQDLVPGLPEEYRLSTAVDVNDRDEVLAHAYVEDGGPVRVVTLVLRPELDR